jgi:Skp family chaperone for outer membrane proteins
VLSGHLLICPTALPPEVVAELGKMQAKLEALEAKLKAAYEAKLQQAKQEVTDYIETVIFSLAHCW